MKDKIIKRWSVLDIKSSTTQKMRASLYVARAMRGFRAVRMADLMDEAAEYLYQKYGEQGGQK